MMIPGTYVVALLLTVISMLCWGSWANTMKLSGKWRFELYYFDYTLGVLACALLAALTFGSIESVPADMPGVAFSFFDNMSISGKKQMAWAAGGGVIFNIANLLLVAAISVAGLSVAFPVGIGVALITGVVLNYILKPAGNPALLFGGVGVVLLAIIVTALAHSAHAAGKLLAQPAPAPTVAGARAVHRPGSRQGGTPSPIKGIALSLAAGLLMGLFYPLVEMSKRGDLGLGPYAAAFCFAVGILLSTPIFNLFFMNLPVEGDPVSFKQYFTGTRNQHLLGIAGGAIWCVGTVANFVAASAPPSVNVGPAVSYAMGQGATLVSTLWGLFVWKEFAGATPGVRGRLALMLVLYVIGLAMLSLAPLYN
jgi:glucose uptake protein